MNKSASIIHKFTTIINFQKGYKIPEISKFR